MSSSYRNSLNNWLANLDVKASRVLDIGGSQLSLPKRVKSWDVGEYLIADLPEPHEDSPKPDIEMDLNKHVSLGDRYKADLIFCLEVFDYIYDPMMAMQNISNRLFEGGTAWVSFPFAYPTHNPIEDDMLRYTEFAIYKLAESVGLRVEEIIKRRPETDLLNQFYRAERMRAAKHYDHNVTGFIAKLCK